MKISPLTWLVTGLLQRLLQGEVDPANRGALAAMLQVVGAGYQAVLVAPTQVLAEQHFETIGKMVADLNVPVTLLTGGMKTRSPA